MVKCHNKKIYSIGTETIENDNCDEHTTKKKKINKNTFKKQSNMTLTSPNEKLSKGIKDNSMQSICS